MATDAPAGGSHRPWMLGTVLSFALAGLPAVPARAGEDPVVRVDRNTILDRAAVGFLKGLVKTTSSDRERLVILGPDGQVLAATDGSQSEVDVPDFDRSALDEDEGVVLVHTHPSSTSFSRADLLHLSRPGVEAVVAIGSDGSVYFATRGPRFVANGVGALHDKAAAAADAMWRAAGTWQAGASVRPEPHFAHIIAQSLAAAGVIVYRASMPFDRERSYFDGTVPFALMSEAAACEVKDALR